MTQTRLIHITRVIDPLTRIHYLDASDGEPLQMTTLDTTQLCLTNRQITIAGIALLNFYDTIAKSGEGDKMMDDIMELSEYMQKQWEYYHD